MARNKGYEPTFEVSMFKENYGEWHIVGCFTHRMYAEMCKDYLKKKYNCIATINERRLYHTYEDWKREEA